MNGCPICELLDDGIFLLKRLCHFSNILLQPSDSLLSHVILLRIIVGQVLDHVVLGFDYFAQEEAGLVEPFIQHVLALL